VICLQNLRFLSSAVREILGWSKNLKFKSRDHGHAPLWPFSVYNSLRSIRMQNLRLVSSAVPEILEGSQNLKSMLRDQGYSPFWTIFHFWYSISFTINPHAKFEVCIFSRSRDIRGSENLKFRSRDRGQASFWRIFSERELMFTFAICRRPSVCLSTSSVVCRL